MTRARFAAFVSPHGYGHAARASAVMAALHARTGAEFEIFSTVPAWFFAQSLSGTFRHHPVACDVGFRQRSALRIDLEQTLVALERLVPFDDDLVDQLAREVRRARCSAVLVDIAPLGIAVAERAGIPSVLVENFSWSWLYASLFEEAPRFRRFAAELAEWEALATVHVQTEPLCWRDPDCELLPPIAREPRGERHEIRSQLDLEGPVVLLTMGGYAEELPFLERLAALEGVTFLVTGSAKSEQRGALRLFDRETPLFMPDLLRAADAIVAKLGYGTVAEVWRDGIPFAWVTRPDFAEMPPLEAFCAREFAGFQLDPEEFGHGDWITRIPELLALPRVPRRPGGGAERVAEILAGMS